ncbi:MAG: C4-dicarboxylate ABC transporter substrate-binding protein, partial [Rhodospirillales bacterium]|nr:C4-dicarboxylate ABC transporter substrate-binding protein [Rhodospirillales bacterium]
LDKGVIDAADYTVFSTNDQQGMHKVANNPVYPGFHSMPILDVSMNKKKWDGLPKDVQAAFMKQGGEKISLAGGAAYSGATQKIIKANPQAQKLTVVKPSGAAFDKLAKDSKISVHSWWIKKTKNGQAVYNKAVEIIADVRKNG